MSSTVNEAEAARLAVIIVVPSLFCLGVHETQFTVCRAGKCSGFVMHRIFVCVFHVGPYSSFLGAHDNVTVPLVAVVFESAGWLMMLEKVSGVQSAAIDDEYSY